MALRETNPDTANHQYGLRAFDGDFGPTVEVEAVPKADTAEAVVGVSGLENQVEARRALCLSMDLRD